MWVWLDRNGHPGVRIVFKNPPPAAAVQLQPTARLLIPTVSSSRPGTVAMDKTSHSNQVQSNCIHRRDYVAKWRVRTKPGAIKTVDAKLTSPDLSASVPQ